jgi:hypothetical protein
MIVIHQGDKSILLIAPDIAEGCGWGHGMWDPR